MPPTSKALAAPKLSAAEITNILQKAGAIDDNSSTFNRMKVDASMFIAGDDMYAYNPKTDEPAFIARLIAAPAQYQSLWWNIDMAEFGGRTEDIPDTSNPDSGFMCRSWYDKPEQNRKFSENGASCDNCAFGPFVDIPTGFKNRCSWKGDVQLQVIPESGQLTGDETIWTLTLSTTSMVEFRGTRKERVKGSATDFNFMHRLAMLAVEKAPEWGIEPDAAVLLALTSLASGGVAAEARIYRQTSSNKAFSWSIVSFNPIHIEPPTGSTLALDDGEEVAI